MALGSYMGVSFTVSDRRILTPSGLKGQGGSDWATHNRTGARARSQWIAPKLRKYQFDLLLRAQDVQGDRGFIRHLDRTTAGDDAGIAEIGLRIYSRCGSTAQAILDTAAQIGVIERGLQELLA